MRTVRQQNKPQGDEGAAGLNMTSSDCVLREGSGGPTSAGKLERHRSTGGVLLYEVGHPIAVCQTAVATQVKGVHREAGK